MPVENVINGIGNLAEIFVLLRNWGTFFHCKVLHVNPPWIANKANVKKTQVGVKYYTHKSMK